MQDQDTYLEIQHERRQQAALREHDELVEKLKDVVYAEFVEGQHDEEFLNELDTRTVGRILRQLAVCNQVDLDDLREIKNGADAMVEDTAERRATR